MDSEMGETVGQRDTETQRDSETERQGPGSASPPDTADRAGQPLPPGLPGPDNGPLSASARSGSASPSLSLSLLPPILRVSFSLCLSTFSVCAHLSLTRSLRSLHGRAHATSSFPRLSLLRLSVFSYSFPAPPTPSVCLYRPSVPPAVRFSARPHAGFSFPADPRGLSSLFHTLPPPPISLPKRRSSWPSPPPSPTRPALSEAFLLPFPTPAPPPPPPPPTTRDFVPVPLSGSRHGLLPPRRWCRGRRRRWGRWRFLLGPRGGGGALRDAGGGGGDPRAPAPLSAPVCFPPASLPEVCLALQPPLILLLVFWGRVFPSCSSRLHPPLPSVSLSLSLSRFLCAISSPFHPHSRSRFPVPSLSFFSSLFPPPSSLPAPLNPTLAPPSFPPLRPAPRWPLLSWTPAASPSGPRAPALRPVSPSLPPPALPHLLCGGSSPSGLPPSPPPSWSRPPSSSRLNSWGGPGTTDSRQGRGGVPSCWRYLILTRNPRPWGFCLTV
ncbi:uncharacterized protein [Equus caballus]|uniref:uncharacterized protein n=1 Tax=Equus caballus TaxID=9796 RepID=UPI0038B3AAA2